MTQAKKQSSKTKLALLDMTKVSLFTALLCVLAPLTIITPFSPIGITLGSFLVYLTGGLLGAKLGAISIFLYLALGFVGVPVFSGYSSGVAKLFGPTGGYLIGYLLCVIIVGLFTGLAKEKKTLLPFFLLGTLLGSVTLYTFGTFWFVFVYAEKISFADALLSCVVPFLPFDFVKVIISGLLILPLRLALNRRCPYGTF